MDVPEIGSYGQRLQEAIRLRGIPKLCVLSLDIGVSESALSRWLRSEPITLENFAKLCVVLDVSADWLLLERGGMIRRPSSNPLPMPHRRLMSALRQMHEDDVHRLHAFLHGVMKR